MEYFVHECGVMLSAAVFSGGAKHLARVVDTAREIPRPAGEGAGLRDDASQVWDALTLWLNSVLYGARRIQTETAV